MKHYFFIIFLFKCLVSYGQHDSIQQNLLKSIADYRTKVLGSINGEPRKSPYLNDLMW